ncbi:hypothetical protein Tco_1295089 [Tanacetum coccineum]
MNPIAVLMRSGLVSFTTARPVNTAQPRTVVNSTRPIKNVFNKAHSTVRRPINIKTTTKNNIFNKRVNTVSGKNVNTARPKAVVNAARPKVGNPQMDLQDQGVIDSGCSRYMTGNMSYLTDFEEINEGYVAFRGNPKRGINTQRVNYQNFSRMTHPSPKRNMVPKAVLMRPKAVVNAARLKAVLNAVKGNQVNAVKGLSMIGFGNHGLRYVAFGGNLKGRKIIGRGTIKAGNLDFENVYFVRELQFNLFSVLQVCDKKNNVLFNDTECIVLSTNFKLTDESHVLLKVPRKNNMYSVDLKNIVPKRGLTCLFEKATSDESKL